MRSKLGIRNLGIGKFVNEEFGVMNMRIESAEMGLSELYESILFIGGSFNWGLLVSRDSITCN